MIHLWFERIALKKWSIGSKSFPTFYAQEQIDPLFFAQLLFFKERREQFALVVFLWKSDHEQIAPVALYKRVTMSDLLLLLMKKEQHKQIAVLLICSQKTSNLLEKPMREFPTLVKRGDIINQPAVQFTSK